MILRKSLLAVLMLHFWFVWPADGQEFSGPDELQARQKIVGLLLRQLDNLIPGKYEADSDQSKKLAGIADEFANGNEAAVRSRIEELNQLDPDLPPADLLLAGMSFAINNPVPGEILLERAGKLHPDHPGIPLAFSQLAIAQNRLYDALALIEKMQRLIESAARSDEWKVFYRKAALSSLTVIETRRQDPGSAREYARQWEQLDPDNETMLNASAELEFLLDHLDESLKYLGRRNKESRRARPAELVVAKWYRGKSDRENYSRWIREAYGKYPDNDEVQLEYGAWLLLQEDFDAAEKIVEGHEPVFGESAETVLIKGRVAFARRDFKSAESWFERLYQQQPNNAEYAYLYVQALLESSDTLKWQKASAIAQRSYQAYPSNQLTIASLGRVMVMLGNNVQGMELLRRLTGSGSAFPDAAYFYAEALASQGDDEKAKQVLASFLDTREVFLYRQDARKLLEQIENGEEMPKPDGQRE